MDKFHEYLRNYEQNVQADIDKRISFIRQQVLDAGLNGAVVGISGGLDSAVTAALCVKALGRERVIGAWMPIHSMQVHADDSHRLAEAINLNLVTVDLGAAFESFTAALSAVLDQSDKTKGNTKARLRMTTLYAIANQKGYLVADTCNQSELYVGYMTKGGDGLSDFNPVASLTKHEMWIIARALGVPESIITKAPSADLWEGQTDEQEMGLSYEELDRYLITGETSSPEALQRIEYLHQISEHKRRPVPEI